MKRNVPVLIYDENGYKMLTLGQVFNTLSKHFSVKMAKRNPTRKKYASMYHQAKEIDENKDYRYLYAPYRVIIAKGFEGDRIEDDDLLEKMCDYIEKTQGKAEMSHFLNLLNTIDYGETLSNPQVKGEKVQLSASAIMKKYNLNSSTIKKYDVKEGKLDYYGIDDALLKKSIINCGVFIQFCEYCDEHGFNVELENLPKPKTVVKPPALEPVEPVKVEENHNENVGKVETHCEELVRKEKQAKKEKESKFKQLSLFDIGGR